MTRNAFAPIVQPPSSGIPSQTVAIFDVYADAVVYSPATAPQVIQTYGYGAVLDQGGALYYADGAGTDLVINLSGGGTQGYTVGNAVLCPKMFGASAAASAVVNTAALQLCLDRDKPTLLPDEILVVSADTGIEFYNESVMYGSGMASILWAELGTGGTLSELVNYQAGSVLHRNAPDGIYVNRVQFSNFAIVLNHPTNAITTTKIQLGLDMRNASGYSIYNVWSGNYSPDGSKDNAANFPKAFMVQGYNFASGTLSGGANYCGGERGVVDNCKFFGGYRIVNIDDNQLSPNSSSHGTIVQNCDISTGMILINQGSQYAAGVETINNVLQDCRLPSGNVGSRAVYNIVGYDGRFQDRYIEAGTCELLVTLNGASKRNIVDIGRMSASGGNPVVTDTGLNNRISMWGNTGTVVNGWDNLGPRVELYNRAYVSPWVKFHWDGSAIVIDASYGVSGVTRAGVGDYTITWELPFVSAKYDVTLNARGNASGNPVSNVPFTAGTSTLRVTTWTIDPATGVTSLFDSTFIYCGARQL